MDYQHTPSPWTIADREIVSPHIAADPELLEALQNLATAAEQRESHPGFASAGNYLRALDAARAAIAKVIAP